MWSQLEVFQLLPGNPPLSHQEVIQTEVCELLIMNVMRGGAGVDILVVRIRASEIIMGTGETVLVMSKAPHDEGAVSGQPLHPATANFSKDFCLGEGFR